MLENGDVKVINNYRELDPNISTYERNLNQFFEKVNLNENRRKRMRYILLKVLKILYFFC